MSRFKLSATIPVGQYANIIPEIEIDELSLSDQEAQQVAFDELHKIWDKYGVVPLNQNHTNRQKIEAFVGGTIYYDDATHTYTNEAGEKYLSGSEYAAQSEKPFDVLKISEAMAKKSGVKAEDIQAMWKLKSGISTGFGTAVHEAIELYGRYRGLGDALNKTTHLHDHATLKPIVEGFYELQGDKPVEHEIVIVDHEAKRAGRIDRLVVTGKKKGVIQDIKTNVSIEKSLDKYWKQLEFYRDIVVAGGWVIEGLEIYHFNGDWKLYEHI